MANLRVVEPESAAESRAHPAPFPVRVVIQWIIGIVAAFGLGTWLVWWAAYVQRRAVLEDVRGACQRVMPETVDRCVDTVTIQRGGARR